MDNTTNLDRFLGPQESAFPQACRDLAAGRKEGHWMWYIFPQIRGLGSSVLSTYYCIEDLAEAREYLAHPVLGQRLRQITVLLLILDETDPMKIFGWTDSLKLRSCMTLFARAGGDDCFRQVLDKYYQGQEDPLTLGILAREGAQQ